MAKKTTTTMTETPDDQPEPTVVITTGGGVSTADASSTVNTSTVIVSPQQSIEISHAWRRGATASQFRHLANAMELGRNGLLEIPEDGCLDDQRRAYNAFSRLMLGSDGPQMEVGL